MDKALPLSSIIRDDIIDRILAGELTPGDTLPAEAEIARQAGASKTAVREALHELFALGIIDLHKGRPAMVRALNPGPLNAFFHYAVGTQDEGLVHITEVRQALESEIAALAAVRGSSRDARRLRQILASMTELEAGTPELLEADLRFHRHLAKMADNPILTFILDSINEQIMRSIDLTAGRLRPDEKAGFLDRHEGVCAAVERRDAEGARAAIRNHFEGNWRIRQVLESGIRVPATPSRPSGKSKS